MTQEEKLNQILQKLDQIELRIATLEDKLGRSWPLKLPEACWHEYESTTGGVRCKKCGILATSIWLAFTGTPLTSGKIGT